MLEMKQGKRWTWLTMLVHEYDLRLGAEVGVRKGNNMTRVMRSCPNLRWIAVDPWLPYSEAPHWKASDHKSHKADFLRSAETFGGRVTVLEMPSLEGAKQIQDGRLDFVFIDADHRYEPCRADILAWRPKIRPGGWLTGHDCDNLPRFPGVGQAVRELCPGYYRGPDWIWYIQV